MRFGRATSPQAGVIGAAAAGPGAPGPTLPGPVSSSRLRAVSEEEYADWEAVYRDNIAWVYRLMFTKVGNRPDAEDLTTEVFMAALRPLRLPSAAPAVRAYLLVTCRSALARHWARTLGQQVTTLPEEVADAVAEARVDSGASALQRAERILAELPERYRAILQLRFLDACSIAEAAKTLGISVGNAKVLQHRALRRASEVGAEMDAVTLGEAAPGETER